MKKNKKPRVNTKPNPSITEIIDAEYKAMPGYGVQFGIEPESYECRLGDRVRFGEGVTESQNGSINNYQDVLLDGKTIGWLHERQSHNIFHPMTISFKIWIADCNEREKITDEMRSNPHFSDEGEYYCMRFATLNQMLDYLKIE